MAGIALDGTPVHGLTSSATTIQVMPSFTTTVPGLILLAAEINHGTITSINTTGLTWAAKTVLNDGIVFADLELWFAYSNSALNAATTTINLTGASDYISATQFSFKNVDKSTPFDINGSLPATTQTNATVSVTTTHPETAVIGIYRSADTATLTQGTGFTLISGSDFMLVEYKIVTTAQTGLSVAVGTIGTIHQAIAHAVSGFDYAPPFRPPSYANKFQLR